jgi:hypothetical protein
MLMLIAALSAMVVAASSNAASVHLGIPAVAEASPINVLRVLASQGVARTLKQIVGQWVMGAAACLIAELALHQRPAAAPVFLINAEQAVASS